MNPRAIVRFAAILSFIALAGCVHSKPVAIKMPTPVTDRTGEEIVVASPPGVNRKQRPSRSRIFAGGHASCRALPQLFRDDQMPRSSRKRSIGAELAIERMR